MIPRALLDVSNNVTTSGASADMHEGSLKDMKVCVKRLRVCHNENPEKVKVQNQTHSSPGFPLPHVSDSHFTVRLLCGSVSVTEI